MGTAESDMSRRDSIRLDSDALLSSAEEARLTFMEEPSQEYKLPFTPIKVAIKYQKGDEKYED